jgi:hypothetical protein
MKIVVKVVKIFVSKVETRGQIMQTFLAENAHFSKLDPFKAVEHNLY